MQVKALHFGLLDILELMCRETVPLKIKKILQYVNQCDNMQVLVRKFSAD